LFKPVNF